MEPQGLNVLDYSVLGIVLLSGLLALMRGFVREVFSLAAWVGAYFAAAKYYNLAEPWVHRTITKNPTGGTVIAAGLVFVVALIILSIIGHLLAKLIRGRALTAIDRSLGFLFGLMRGALIVCLIYLVCGYVPWMNMDKLDKPNTAVAAPAEPATAAEKEKNKRDEPPEWLVHAKTRPVLASGANMLKKFIPEKEIEKTMNEYDEQKTNAHQMIDDQARDISGMPAPAPPPKPEVQPAYDDRSRTNLNNLVIQKDKP